MEVLGMNTRKRHDTYDLDVQILAAAGAKLPRNSTVEDYAKNLSGPARTDLINDLQKTIDDVRDGLRDELGWHKATPHRHRAIRLLQRLTKICNTLPAILFISNVQCSQRHDPKYRGGFADVFIGRLGTSWVALKRLRTYIDNKKELDEIFHRVSREVVLWRQLTHTHILPFFGVDYDTFRPLCTIVSPWMENGNMLAYIENHTPPTTEIDRLLSEVAEGLQYLHSENIVHGDLRAANVLIDDGRRVRLADFGLTFVADFTSAAVTTGIPHTNTRWLAPELLEMDAKSTPASDIYAWACVCLEGYTLKSPRFYIKVDAQVLLAVARKDRMRQPSRDECHGHVFTNARWALMEQCWSPEPWQRPASQDLLRLLAWLENPSAAAVAVPYEQFAARPNPSRLDMTMVPVPMPASAPTPVTALSYMTLPPYSSPLSPFYRPTSLSPPYSARGNSSLSPYSARGSLSQSPYSANGSSSLSPYPTSGTSSQSPYSANGSSSQSPYSANGSASLSPYWTSGSSPSSPPSSVSPSGSNPSPISIKSHLLRSASFSSRRPLIRWPSMRSKSSANALQGNSGPIHQRNLSVQELRMHTTDHGVQAPTMGDKAVPFPAAGQGQQLIDGDRRRKGRPRSISLTSPRPESLSRDDAEWMDRVAKKLRGRITRQDAELRPRGDVIDTRRSGQAGSEQVQSGVDDVERLQVVQKSTFTDGDGGELTELEVIPTASACREVDPEAALAKELKTVQTPALGEMEVRMSVASVDSGEELTKELETAQIIAVSNVKASMPGKNAESTGELAKGAKTTLPPAIGDLEATTTMEVAVETMGELVKEPRSVSACTFGKAEACMLNVGLEGQDQSFQRSGVGHDIPSSRHQNPGDLGTNMWISAARESIPDPEGSEGAARAAALYRLTRGSLRAPFSPTFGPPETEQWAPLERDGEGRFVRPAPFERDTMREGSWGCIESALEAFERHNSGVPLAPTTLRLSSEEEANLRSAFEDSVEDLSAECGHGIQGDGSAKVGHRRLRSWFAI